LRQVWHLSGFLLVRSFDRNKKHRSVEICHLEWEGGSRGTFRSRSRPRAPRPRYSPSECKAIIRLNVPGSEGSTTPAAKSFDAAGYDVEILRILRVSKTPMTACAILDAVRNNRVTAAPTVYRTHSRLIAEDASPFVGWNRSTPPASGPIARSCRCLTRYVRPTR
jgi:hypothetical protein